jgi:protein required for attachment to host cells
MNKKISLVLIANSTEAKFFEKTGNIKFELDLICEAVAELDSNHEKPGRAFSSGSLRHAIVPHTDRRLVEKHHFAEKISQIIAEIEKERKFDGLILMGSHKILEELEKTLSNPLKKKITHKLAKDIIEFNKNEVKEYLEKNLI